MASGESLGEGCFNELNIKRQATMVLTVGADVAMGQAKDLELDHQGRNELEGGKLHVELRQSDACSH